MFHGLQTVTIREVVAQYRRPIESLFKVTGPADVAKFVRKLVDDNPREHFIVLHLDVANQVVSYTIAAIGTVSNCLVHPREVFQSALLANASNIILAHNHPTGNLTPSPQDHSVTDRLKEAGELLGITVVDHLIVTSEGYRSVMHDL